MSSTEVPLTFEGLTIGTATVHDDGTMTAEIAPEYSDRFTVFFNDIHHVSTISLSGEKMNTTRLFEEQEVTDGSEDVGKEVPVQPGRSQRDPARRYGRT